MTEELERNQRITRTQLRVREVELTAQNMRFDKDRLTVPADEEVTVVLNNRDEGMSHSFSVYEDPEFRTAFFSGGPVPGPGRAEYRFITPSQRTVYFFRCDEHPEMKGQLVIE